MKKKKIGEGNNGINGVITGASAGIRILHVFNVSNYDTTNMMKSLREKQCDGATK